MGKILCEKHGSGALVSACSHVAEQIDTLTPLVGHRLDTLPILYVCNECFAFHGLEKLADLSSFSLKDDDKVLERRLEATDAIEGMRYFCSKCIAELEQAAVQDHVNPSPQ